MSKNIKLVGLIILGLLILGLAVFFSSGNASTVLWNLSSQGKWLLPLLVVSAVIDSINPCAFSILILTIGFLFSMGKERSNILFIGSVYILGLFVVYFLIGLGIIQTLHLFNTPHFMARVGAILLIALGAINLINEFFPAFPIKLRIPNAAHNAIAKLMHQSSVPAVFMLGVLVGLCEFPCTGGPYLMVLGLLHDRATYLSGTLYLILYNLIFILPLVIILLIASNKVLLQKVENWKKKETGIMRYGGSVVMILLGFLILFL